MWKSNQKMIFQFILRCFPVTPLQSLHSSHTIALSEGVIFQKKKKNADFFQKNADISKIKRALALKGIFSETTYVCMYTHTNTQITHTQMHSRMHTYTHTHTKKKFPKFFVPIQHPRNGPFQEFFQVPTLLNTIQFWWNFHHR